MSFPNRKGGASRLHQDQSRPPNLSQSQLRIQQPQHSQQPVRNTHLSHEMPHEPSQPQGQSQDFPEIFSIIQQNASQTLTIFKHNSSDALERFEQEILATERELQIARNEADLNFEENIENLLGQSELLETEIQNHQELDHALEESKIELFESKSRKARDCLTCFIHQTRESLNCLKTLYTGEKEGQFYNIIIQSNDLFEALIRESLLRLENISLNAISHFEEHRQESIIRRERLVRNLLRRYEQNQAFSSINQQRSYKRNITDEEFNERLKCPICFQLFEKNVEYVCLECQHLFHDDCCYQWINVHKSCPVCLRSA